jgi:hypothetical protein
MDAIVAKGGFKQDFQWLLLGKPAPISLCKLDGYMRNSKGEAFDLVDTNFIITDPLEAKFDVVLTEVEMERVFGDGDTVSRGTLEVRGHVPRLNPSLICKRFVEWRA